MDGDLLRAGAAVTRPVYETSHLGPADEPPRLPSTPAGCSINPTPAQRGGAIVTGRIAAPSPNTVVMVPSRQAAEVLACEAELRLEHEAETARLKGTLRDLRQAHAASIARLRAEHAAEMRRLVEALWDAQAVARAASLRARGALEVAASEPTPWQLPTLPRAQV